MVLDLTMQGCWKGGTVVAQLSKFEAGDLVVFTLRIIS
jgi:hypothetical protein